MDYSYFLQDLYPAINPEDGVIWRDESQRDSLLQDQLKMVGRNL